MRVAIRMRDMTATICLLEEVAEFLEDQSDVRDGDDGRPLPNKAMVLLQQVEQEIEALKRASPTATEGGS